MCFKKELFIQNLTYSFLIQTNNKKTDNALNGAKQNY